MGGSVSDDYARGYRDGVEAAAKHCETRAGVLRWNEEEAKHRQWLQASKEIRALPPPPASDALAQEATSTGSHYHYGGRCDLRCPTSRSAYCERLWGHPGDCSWVYPEIEVKP